MKKAFKFYAIIWAICLALFNVIAFAISDEIAGISKFDGAFWVGYIFITITFVGQLICAYFAFKAENIRKLFYNIPLVRISYIGLVVMFIAGALAMGIPGFPIWLAIIVCCTILALTTVGVISTSYAAKAVEDIDAKTQQKTAFIKEITMQAEALIHRANAPMLKKHCKKVYEALRYSDPISNATLADVEQRIKEEFDVLTDAVFADDLVATESSVKELTVLIAERNNQSKLLK